MLPLQFGYFKILWIKENQRKHHSEEPMV
jgi:hypothetical protein